MITDQEIEYYLNQGKEENYSFGICTIMNTLALF